jgi:hypothetical protein
MMMVSAAASFVLVFSKKSYRQEEVRIVVKVKGFVCCWIPVKVEGCPKRSKKEKSSVLGMSPLKRPRAPVQAFQLGECNEVATHSCM